MLPFPLNDKEWQGELWVQPGRQNLFCFRFVGSWFPNAISKQLFRSLKNGAHSDHKITNWKRKYKPIGLEKSTYNSQPSGDTCEWCSGGERLYYFAMSPTCSFFLNQRWRHVEDWVPASVPVKNLSVRSVTSHSHSLVKVASRHSPTSLSPSNSITLSVTNGKYQMQLETVYKIKIFF